MTDFDPKACVYALVDPRNDEIFYIGYTAARNPQWRLDGRILNAGRGGAHVESIGNKYLAARICEIIDDKSVPIIIPIIWTAGKTSARFLESFIIQTFSSFAAGFAAKRLAPWCRSVMLVNEEADERSRGRGSSMLGREVGAS